MKELKFVSEEWKDIPTFDGYEVSNLGRVRGKDRFRKGKFENNSFLKGQFLKQIPNYKGYPEVRFCKKGTHSRVVHRLVATLFIPNPENLPQVNHIDGNKQNNYVNNLEWSDNSRNQIHAYKLGLQPNRSGENNSNSKLTDKIVTNLKLMYNSGKTISEISKLTNINITRIRSIIYGMSWKSNKIRINKRDDRRKKPI